MKPSPRFALLLILAATAALTTYGQSSTASNAAATTPGAAPATATAPAGDAVELVASDATNAMKFSQTEIHAKAGQTVTINFKNAGTLPKAAMGHNFILLKSADLVQPFVNDSLQAGTTDYLPQNHDGDIIVHTKLLGPGETETVTFTAPAKGNYPYLCTFPGHYAVGMKGELIVE